MRLKLDKNSRKYIDVEIEIDGKAMAFKYFEKNTRQIKAVKQSIKDEQSQLDVDDLFIMHFDENFQGNPSDIEDLKNYYEENGNFYEFVTSLEEELGKQKGRD